MNARKILLLLSLSLCLGLAPSIRLGEHPVAAAEVGVGGPNGAALQRLSELTGHPAAALELSDIAAEVLLDGRQIVTVKARDGATGEIVGATFAGQLEGPYAEVVDRDAARAAAGTAWRAAHGALTPALVARLAAMGPEERIDVTVWLAAEIQALPLPALPRAEDAADGMMGTAGGLALSELSTSDGTPADAADSDGAPLWPAPATKPPEGPIDRSDEIRAAQRVPLADVEAQKAENDAALRAQVAPLREGFLARLQAHGLQAGYAGDGVPTVYLTGLTRAEIELLASWPEIDAIYVVPDFAGPSMAAARPTQNGTLINDVGYDGDGVTVAVIEGERVFAANPYLALAGFRDGTQDFAQHPTGVAGIIRSTHALQRGVASHASVYSANGSYSNWGTMAAAMDWGRTQATVLNNSWYWDSPNSAVFWEADRRLDYYVRYNRDFVTVAAGNFGNSCGSGFTSYVVSPAKGFNVLSVGNYDDLNTLTWTGDAMNACSSFGDPGGDSATPTHAKPEVAAVGTVISSTLTSAEAATAIGPIGSGTSYSSPMVAALAANLIEADSRLAAQPEALRAIIMATALHNIEGSSRLSDVDGTGGVNMTAAAATVERGNWSSRTIGTSTVFPLPDYTMYAYKGERVRFVITWLSNPTASYTSDPLPADLDLSAYRADGTSLLVGSSSIGNSFEIVDFIAPASETYRFRVTRWGSWSGSGTYLGTAGWKGTYRISPNAAYLDPAATPLGTHLSIHPTDWPNSAYWRAMGIRSANSDHDLVLWSGSWFDDPSTRSSLVGSYSGASVDYILVDGRHRSSQTPDHYRVSRYSGTGGYHINWANRGLALSNAGTYGPYTIGGSGVVDVFDILFVPGRGLRITVIPTSNVSDLAVELFRSNPGTPSTWTKASGGGVAQADAHGVSGQPESLTYRIPANGSTDWLGLVISKKNSATVSYYLRIELQVFLPLVIRTS